VARSRPDGRGLTNIKSSVKLLFCPWSIVSGAVIWRAVGGFRSHQKLGGEKRTDARSIRLELESIFFFLEQN